MKLHELFGCWQEQATISNMTGNGMSCQLMDSGFVDDLDNLLENIRTTIDEPHLLCLDSAELYTVLGALRLYLKSEYAADVDRPNWLQEIVCPDGDNTPSLDADAVDVLCEKINVEPAKADIPHGATRIDKHGKREHFGPFANTDDASAWALKMEDKGYHSCNVWPIIATHELSSP